MQSTLFLHGAQVRFAPIGHEQVTVGAAAVSLPGLANYDLNRITRVVLRNIAYPVNWRDDGVDPTAGTGFPLMADEVFVYDGADLTKFRLIRAASNDVDVRVIYYGT